MPRFRRPHHQAIDELLHGLNADLLARAACYFGGGTQLALTMGEYRESRDIDFLCSSRTGYRLLREQVTSHSLGDILASEHQLAREVRADRDGIRTFIVVGETKIKFEILLEARIELGGEVEPRLAVPMLSRPHAIAEKLLANTDRGLDESTLSRDLIDLAFVATHASRSELDLGLSIAEQAYGQAIREHLRLTLASFQQRSAHAKRCIEVLGISDTTTLRKGLRALGKFSSQD